MTDEDRLKKEEEEEEEEEEFQMMLNIPIDLVNHSLRVELSKKLDPQAPMGNNWAMMAEKLGYSNDEINHFYSHKGDGWYTLEVLKDFSYKQNSTVNRLYNAIQQINRPDVLDIIKAAIPEIEVKYKESIRKKQSNQVENGWSCQSCAEGGRLTSLSSYYPPSSHSMQSKCSHSYMVNCSPVRITHADNIAYHRHKSHEGAPLCLESIPPHYDLHSPEFKRMRMAPLSDSMKVHGRDNLSQYYRDSEPMDHSPSMREEGVPANIAMMRNNPYYNGNPSLMRQSISYTSGEKLEYSKSPGRPGLNLKMPNPCNHMGPSKNEFISPGVTPTTPSTPLGCLNKMVYPQQFPPEDSYTDLIRMKQQQEISQIKTAQYITQNFPDNHAKSGVPVSPPGISYDGVTSPRAKKEPPNTFPLRLKSTSPSSSISSAQLVKSVSLPNDMKPVVRKSYRHITVFVTYAADDNRHTKRVIKLCDNMVANRFKVGVDMSRRKLTAEERQDWYLKRFEEADFIIVVISPAYRDEVDSVDLRNGMEISESFDSDTETENESRHQCMHTKQLYRLMYQEYCQNGPGRKRFVPVLFPGVSTTLIPPWMMTAYQKLIYQWPGQYQDLLWMLSKPGNRVPENVTSSSDVDMGTTSEEGTETYESVDSMQESDVKERVQ